MQPQETPLGRFRTERGLSLNQLAIHTGVDRFTLSRWEKGIPPRLDIVERFARAYDLDVNDWRVENGYEAVEVRRPEPETSGDRNAQKPDLSYNPVFHGIINAYGGPENIPPEDIEILQGIAEMRARQRRRKQN